MKLRPYQTQAVEKIRDAIRRKKKWILYVSPTGCHAKGQGILMFNGTIKPIEEIEVGDLVMGPDSLPRLVKKLFRGFDMMYQILPVKGQSFVVNSQHILTLIHTETGELTDVSVKIYLQWNKWQKHLHKLKRYPVEFAIRHDLSIEPYFLGLLLGDGSLTKSIGISKPDKFIRLECEKQAAQHDVRIRTSYSYNNCPTHFFTRGNMGRKPNPILNKIKTLGIFGCKSDTKFIPIEYKTASRTDRMELLAGLLDTDGYCKNGGYDYISKSFKLAEDVAFLARSLGFAAYVQQCEKSCQTGARGTYYRLYISGDCSILPTRRRIATPRRQKKDVTRTGFTISKVGHGACYGFSLNGDGRYLLDDFTVTHNSGKTLPAAYILRATERKGNSAIFVAHRRELIKQCSNKLKEFDVPHALFMAGHDHSMMERIQVCSIQTFHARVTKKDLPKP